MYKPGTQNLEIVLFDQIKEKISLGHPVIALHCFIRITRNSRQRLNTHKGMLFSVRLK